MAQLLAAEIQEIIIVLGIAWRIFLFTWWIWIFLLLFPLVREMLLYWRRELFKRDQKYVLLEISIPRESERGARGMEQVLQALHTLGNSPATPEAKYVEGELSRPISYEIASFGGTIHFYIRAYKGLKSLVESSIFSYYPDVELVEVDDYMDQFPKTFDELDEAGFGLWGTEIVTMKPAAYPPRTYKDFEIGGEEAQIDPISTFLEVLGKLDPQEFVGIQINACPVGADWAKEWDSLVRELRETQKTPTGAVPKSPRQTEVLKAVENNLSKPAFDCTIRFIYIAPKTVYYDSTPRRGVMGAFGQYTALDLNGFRVNFNTWTMTMKWFKPYVFSKIRGVLRKQRIFFAYRRREMPPETTVAKVLSSHPLNWNQSVSARLTTETLATLYHPPMKTVLTAPHLKRAESRKSGPSAGLPIYGSEKALEKFQ